MDWLLAQYLVMHRLYSIAATTTSVAEGQRAHFLIGSEDIPASSDINVNISVTTTGDFFENPVPSRFIR